MDRVLVVANQTLRSDELVAAVLVRNARGPCEFRVVVPATPLSRQEQALRHSEHPGAVLGESGPVAVARMRLAQCLKRLAEANVTATGDVGDPNPMKAVLAATEHIAVDEIMVSTLPGRASRWIAQDLPHKLNRRLGLPVTHIETGTLHVGGRHNHVPNTATDRSLPTR